MKQYGTVLACVRLGSYASLLALIPIGFGTVFFVLGMGELGLGGISVLSLWTLFWLSVLIFGFFDRGILITYRPKRYVRGAIILVVVIPFLALVGWLVWTKGDSPWLIAAFVIPAILAVTPMLYDFFGRLEFVIGAGRGHYFYGVGKIGVRREFSFDKTTGVRKGESAYCYADHSVGHKNVTGTMAMTRIPEVQLFPVGCATPARLCASDDEALIDAFVRLLREAIQHQDMYGT